MQMLESCNDLPQIVGHLILSEISLGYIYFYFCLELSEETAVGSKFQQ